MIYSTYKYARVLGRWYTSVDVACDCAMCRSGSDCLVDVQQETVYAYFTGPGLDGAVVEVVK